MERSPMLDATHVPELGGAPFLFIFSRNLGPTTHVHRRCSFNAPSCRIYPTYIFMNKIKKNVCDFFTNISFLELLITVHNDGKWHPCLMHAYISTYIHISICYVHILLQSTHILQSKNKRILNRIFVKRVFYLLNYLHV